ncbi:2-oxo-4-hydroxy-4-carboxy-5-ureidoimidazoline decarboxylase [Gluconobacter wancherniae]|uniref:2-oxo-4-hydroxy-4-carboxy-5-ureidoimidazoline decarboxylase n=1 Tax=Gluconobacter wancherniae TaxID=1307955 RepID=UPI0030AF4A59
MNIQNVNALSVQEFVDVFGAAYEHSPWIAECAALKRPFADLKTMLQAFSEVVKSSGEAVQLKLVRAHPELGHRAGVDPELGAASASEQASAGLDRLSPEEYSRFKVLNEAYLQKFGMPFVICVRLAGQGAAKTVIMDAMERRLEGSAKEELVEALTQIDAIAGLRIKDIVTQ